MIEVKEHEGKNQRQKLAQWKKVSIAFVCGVPCQNPLVLRGGLCCERDRIFEDLPLESSLAFAKDGILDDFDLSPESGSTSTALPVTFIMEYKFL